MSSYIPQKNKPLLSSSASFKHCIVEINDRLQTLACICFADTRLLNRDGLPIKSSCCCTDSPKGFTVQRVPFCFASSACRSSLMHPWWSMCSLGTREKRDRPCLYTKRAHRAYFWRKSSHNFAIFSALVQ